MIRGEYPVSHIFAELEKNNLLPSIIFRSARAQCDSDVEFLARRREFYIEQEHKNEIIKKVKDVINKYEIDPELIITHPQYQALLSVGVGAHHAGQLLVWRLLLEELMSAGLLRILIATGTVAAGVDFPARTVVITAHSRRGAEGFQNLSSSELQQMSGRAGRRGKDTVGFCLAAPSKYCDAREVLKISKRPPEPLKSSYYPSPSTVLNLLRFRNVDDLYFTVERSLASYSDRKEAELLRNEAADIKLKLNSANESDTKDHKGYLEKQDRRMRKLINQADAIQRRQMDLLAKTLNALRTLKHVENSSLTKKGAIAAKLYTSLVLELSEFVEEGLLDGASDEKLCLIIASIVGDSHRQYLTSKNQFLDKKEVEKVDAILKLVDSLQVPGGQTDRSINLDGAYTVLVWYRTDSWTNFRSLLMLANVAEGDASRLITQTAESLNQLMRLDREYPILAAAAERARNRLLRPPLIEGLV